MKRTSGWLLALSMGLWCGWVYAIESFVVKDIKVEGLQRISAGTVFNYLPLKVGDTIDDGSAAEAIRALFQTGFFKDVNLQRQGDVLVVTVEERPAISSIKITGNKDIETEELNKALKDLGLAQGQVFNRSLLDKVQQELERQYFSRGKYGVKITTAVTPLERNRVDVAVTIFEGEVARIRQINLIGNQSFSTRELLDQFALTTPGWFTFFTDNDQYSKQKLQADIETLRSYYLDRGYINFTIDSTQVSITPDKRDIYITINLTEGDVYTVREVKLAGNLIVGTAELFPLVSVKAGQTFSRKLTTESANRISERLGNDGYAFANVNTVPEIDKTKKQVGVTLFVDPGKRVYVRRVNISGNAKTRDEVLRREFRQLEGGWFSTAAVNRSRTRLQRLGFFDTVDVETPPVAGTTDQVDVNFKVVERSSGNLTLGLGYSQAQGFLINTSVTQDNFLGTGNRVSLTFNNSDVNTVYSFSYSNPYYTLDGVSRSFGAYFRETDAQEADIANYSTDVAGANISYGIPVSEYTTLRAGGAVESTKLKDTSSSPQVVFDFQQDHGNQFDYLKLETSLAYDTRNRALLPNRGTLQSLSGEATVPGTELEYYKVSLRSLFYVPVVGDWTISLNGEVAYGDGYGDFFELPFFENYFSGGARSVRGYDDNSLGPRDEQDDPIGGNLLVQGNAELILPFFKDSTTFRTTLFFDIGNVFEDTDFQASELRYSTGLAAVWLSPIGPLSFSFGFPLNDEREDDTQAFQFSIGVGL